MRAELADLGAPSARSAHAAASRLGNEAASLVRLARGVRRRRTQHPRIRHRDNRPGTQSRDDRHPLVSIAWTIVAQTEDSLEPLIGLGETSEIGDQTVRADRYCATRQPGSSPGRAIKRGRQRPCAHGARRRQPFRPSAACWRTSPADGAHRTSGAVQRFGQAIGVPAWCPCVCCRGLRACASCHTGGRGRHSAGGRPPACWTELPGAAARRSARGSRLVRVESAGLAWRGPLHAPQRPEWKRRVPMPRRFSPADNRAPDWPDARDARTWKHRGGCPFLSRCRS